MPTFADIAKEYKKLSIIDYFETFARQKSINDKVVNAIKKRLYATGVTGSGDKLKTDNAKDGFYSPYTEWVKTIAGQKTSNVTLKDTGEFYDSIITMANKFEFIIDANFEKDDGHIQRNFTKMFSGSESFEESVLSLTSQELLDIIIEAFFDYFNKEFIK